MLRKWLASLIVLTSCTATQEQAPDFSLKPGTVDADSTLVISFSEYFKKAEIAVTTPSNKRVYLRLRDWAAPPFTELGYFTEAELKISQVTGRIWKDGVSTDVKLFSEEGCYLFTAADILETEPENAQWFEETVCYSKN